ncbi:enoyl-CoA hydratase/isomerase family protein [Kiloniella laminariae]|uniref:Enoyl-CoA hydratase/isomerase family protein n=1 Tax=Kiloniella laminariae TaxID=454162 RepID=A0ABT4LQB3_9PROT|nr:enoyl-CoA hydratase/isomerase family protein [Kiloniella laminariae]MCZ4282511.1 enoyl-CoA hydratase/isomerase family protein [Kiloniella laminariae]
MSYQTLEIEIREAAAWVWMNRPDIHNALDEVMIAELTDAFTTLGKDISVRAIVLAGRGKSFSAGADLGWMKRAATFSEEENRQDALKLAKMLQAIAHCSKPVIARVQGAAFGGGVGLTAAADIAIAGEHAKFCLSEVKLGLVPATIAPYVVAAMGERQARRYFLTAEVIRAERAREIGFVHESCADDQLDVMITEILAALKLAAPDAVDVAKDLIRSVSNRQLDEKLMGETAELIARQRLAPEAREGLTAFFEKRKASWVA